MAVGSSGLYFSAIPHSLPSLPFWQGLFPIVTAENAWYLFPASLH